MRPEPSPAARRCACIVFKDSIRQNARFAKVDTGVVKTDTSIRCFPCNFALFGNELKEFFLNMIQRTMVYNLSKQIAKIQVSTLSSTQYMEIFEPGDIALLYLGPHWGPTYFGSTVSNYPWLQKSKSSATPHFYGGVLCELATTAIGVYCQPIGFHSRLGSDWLLGTSTLGKYVTMVRGGCHSSLLWRIMIFFKYL